MHSPRTYSVDVRNGGWWKVVIYDKIYAFKIYASTHQLCTNQHPDFTFSEATHDIISLEKKGMIMDLCNWCNFNRQLSEEIFFGILELLSYRRE